MEKINKKSLLFALLYSFLICLAGGILAGAIYYWGWITSWVSFIVASLSFLVYHKFYKVNWLSFLWIVFWTFAFSEIAFMMASGMIVSITYNFSFSEGMQIFIETLITNAEYNTLFIKDTIINLVFSLIGVTWYFVYLKIQEKRAKKLAQQNILMQNNQDEKINDEIKTLENKSNFKTSKTGQKSSDLSDLNKIYNLHFINIVKELRVAVNMKDIEQVKQIYSKYIKSASKEKLDYFSKKVNELLNKPDLKDEQIKVLKIIKEKFL